MVLWQRLLAEWQGRRAQADLRCNDGKIDKPAGALKRFDLPQGRSDAGITKPGQR